MIRSFPIRSMFSRCSKFRNVAETRAKKSAGERRGEHQPFEQGIFSPQVHRTPGRGESFLFSVFPYPHGKRESPEKEVPGHGPGFPAQALFSFPESRRRAVSSLRASDRLPGRKSTSLN